MDANGTPVDVSKYDTLNMGSGGESPTGQNVIHVNIEANDLPTGVEGARVIGDATKLNGIPDGHFRVVQANHIPGDEVLAKGMIQEGFRVLKPGGTGIFSSSSLSNVKEIMVQAGFKNITKQLAPRTMIDGRMSMPAIQYTGVKPAAG